LPLNEADRQAIVPGQATNEKLENWAGQPSAYAWGPLTAIVVAPRTARWLAVALRAILMLGLKQYPPALALFLDLAYIAVENRRRRQFRQGFCIGA